MEEHSTGLILRTRLLTETSLIVHWLAPEAGRIATVAKGARRPRSPFRGKLDLCFESEFSFKRSKRSDLHQLLEVRTISSHSGLRQNVQKLQQAAYAVAFLERTTEPETPLPEFFEEMRCYLSALEKHPAVPQSVPAWELRSLMHLGQQPDFKQGRLSTASIAIAGTLLEAGWDDILTQSFPPAPLRQLNQFLHGFVIYQFDRLPRGRAPALEAGMKKAPVETGAERESL